MKKIFKLFSIICACATVAAPFAAAAQSGDIIKPWTTVTDFNNSGFNQTYTANGTKDIWFATYSKILIRTNCSAVARDGYTDANGNQVYDNVTGQPGNKYAYISYADGWTKPSSGNNNPGILYVNEKSKANGGLCYGSVRYEADIRYDNTSENESGTNGGIYIYNSTNTTEVIKVPIAKTGSKKGWYIAQPTGGKSSPAANFDEWYHVVIGVDYATKRVSYTMTSYKTGKTVYTSGYGVSDGSTGTFTSTAPLKTTMEIRGLGYANLSVDNVNVTKETYILGETNINADDSAVKATVTVGNDVYADSNTQFGSAVDTVSPTAVFALYDGSKNLISVDYKTQTFDDHSILGASNNSNSAEMRALFAREIDNKTIELSLAKPSQAYTAAVYVLSDMGTLVPYGEPITFDPSSANQ